MSNENPAGKESTGTFEVELDSVFTRRYVELEREQQELLARVKRLKAADYTRRIDRIQQGGES
jgi:Skp family chaperone for outer membrane proteins